MAARTDFSELPVPSIARRVQEEGEVADGVGKLIDEHRGAVLQTLSRVLIYGVGPLMGYVIWDVAKNGRLNLVVWAVSGAILLATTGASAKSLPIFWRSQLVTVGLAAMAILSLFEFGPSLSVGLAYVAPLLLATILLGGGSAYGWATLLNLSILTGAYLTAQEAPSFHPELQVPLNLWIRFSAVGVVALYLFVAIFDRVQSAHWKSLREQLLLRLREERYVDEREKMVRSAGAVQRLESLGRLAGGIAHDFNNSLVVIQCGLGALDDELTAEERKELVDEINEGVTRAAGTARQLLSFAKRNVEEIGVCQPEVVAERLAKDARRLFPANISLDLKLPVKGQVPRVGLSESAIEQILMTLTHNCREALGDRAGRVTIELGESSRTGGLQLTVADDGPGIPKGLEESVFEPFFTTKGEEHTGLGLSTVWATVRRHGGQIELASKEGEGVTLFMHFPRAPEEESPRTQRPRQESNSTHAKQKAVLVLEDEAPIRAALRRVLKVSGLEVVEAGTVAAAREEMEKRRFALLVSDGVLPDGGVGEFIRDFGDRQGAPVILCSGYLEEDLALEGVAQGQCSFLPKPFAPDELIELVERLLTKSRP